MLRDPATISIILILLAACGSSAEFHWDLGENFEPTKALGEYCEYHGYPFEVHYIHSDDGYILQIHRMPNSEPNGLKPAEAVLLMHGLLSSSADYIVTGPNISLAMLLHDKGYDVWLGNSRGNTFSRNHTTLSPSDPAFWDFSWHEIGINDTAATIDFIRNFTDQEKIFYVGYSQGNTQFWVLTSLRPEYNERIKLMMALAPVAFMGHVRGPVKWFSAPAIRAIEQYEKDGYFEVLGSSSALRAIVKIACAMIMAKKGSPMCEAFAIAAGGPSDGMNSTQFGESLVFNPAGCSCKQLLHYALGIQDPGHFRLFNYGYEKNMRLYNSSVPPDYPLHKITCPVALYNSMNDWLAALEDVNLLHSRLANVVEKYTVTTTRIGHFDFGFGPSIRRLVYEHMIKRMKEFWDL